MTTTRAGRRRLRRLVPWGALLPMALTVLVGYLGTALWSLRVSLSSSRTFPQDDFVGLAQYERLFTNERWLLSLQNLAVYGVLFIAACMVIGFLLAVFIDQKVQGEGLLRTVFLYPYAMSFVATGLVWQWVLNPGSGLQEAVRRMGWPEFSFGNLRFIAGKEVSICLRIDRIQYLTRAIDQIENPHVVVRFVNIGVEVLADFIVDPHDRDNIALL